jgi:hypothetical protein
VVIGHEVRGRQPVMTHLEAAEVHTSKGGFAVAERNNSSVPAELLVIEAVKPASHGFNTPMRSFGYHDAAVGEILEAASLMRGYSTILAAGGHFEEHQENYDRLLIAVSDLKLREEVPGQPPSELQMKAGEVRWVPRGTTHATKNIGSSPATFITLEFP